MEKQFFTVHGGWDTIDVMDFYFYKCELKIPIGKFPVGTIIHSVAMMYGSSKMEFYSEDGEKVIGTFDLYLSAS